MKWVVKPEWRGWSFAPLAWHYHALVIIAMARLRKLIPWSCHWQYLHTYNWDRYQTDIEKIKSVISLLPWTLTQNSYHFMQVSCDVEEPSVSPDLLIAGGRRPKYSAVKPSIGSTTGCTITEKAPTRAFSWLKAPTSAFTFKTLLRHYAKRALTPQ